MADCAARDEEKESSHEIEGDAFSGQKDSALARLSPGGLDEFVEHVNSYVVHVDFVEFCG